jgi:hypothetical protein
MIIQHYSYVLYSLSIKDKGVFVLFALPSERNPVRIHLVEHDLVSMFFLSDIRDFLDLISNLSYFASGHVN